MYTSCSSSHLCSVPRDGKGTGLIYPHLSYSQNPLLETLVDEAEAGSASRQEQRSQRSAQQGTAAPGAAPVERKRELDMRDPAPLGPKRSPDSANGASESLKVHNLWWWVFSPPHLISVWGLK